MKTFPPGLSDSLASVLGDPKSCPHCNSSSRVAGDLCVGCLLEAGLDPADEADSDSLAGILAEVHLPDQNWRLGNYEILEEVGRGGMGVIYRARQRHSRRIVAVKRVLSYHADSRETLARFRREAQAAASLDHPNILPIYEVSESEDGLPFFSMKFAPGGSLQQMAPALRDDPRQCVALVAKITRAVQYAHSKGILHRDLKPGNILLDGRGEPLVSDFGLAKWLDTTSDLTRTLTIFGTPGYIAPEQASQAATELKPTADVYSLGAILFDLLAGRPPFLGAHALSVIRQAADTPAPKLRTLSKLADRDLETICSRCLEREPSARYRSAHDLAEDLERWLEGRPIIARPLSSAARTWRWSLRNPLLAGSLAACLLLATTIVARQFRSRKIELALHSDQFVHRSIAILPFLDLDHDVSDPDVSSALASEFQRKVISLGPARIVAINTGGAGSVSDVQEAGHGSNVRAVLSGTYRSLDRRYRVSIRLMNAANGDLLFARQFEVSDLRQAARELAGTDLVNIYGILANPDWSKISPVELDPGMRHPSTRELILSGYGLMSRFTVADLDRAASCFTKVIQIEPASALAHSYLSLAIGMRTHFVSDANLLAEAEIEARRALELSPESADAHRALSGALIQQGKFREALAEATEAIERGGHEQRLASLIANSYRALGRPDRALRWCLMARHWQRPNPSEFDAGIGDCYADLVMDFEAEESYRRASDVHPDLPDGWVGISRLRLIKSDFNGARALAEQHRALNSDSMYAKEMAAEIEFFAREFNRADELYSALAQINDKAGSNFYGAVSCKSALGYLGLRSGNAADGTTLLQEAQRDELLLLKNAPNHAATLYRLSAIESCLQDTSASLRYLEQAIAAGWVDYRSLRLDPRFDGVRNTDEFRRICQDLDDKVTSLRRQTASR